MGRLKLLLIAAVTMAMTIGLAGMASAANISCGQCHGTLDNGTNAVTSNTTDRRGVTEPGYEGSTIPTQDNGIRGLHGIHMNYSSSTYGAAGTQTIAGISGTFSKRGNCSYCHNGHPRHATGFVNFTATATIATKATQPLLGNKYLMVYTSAGRGVSYKNNIPSLVVNPTGNCTKACHKGTSQANPAPWGNYTTASVKLSCSSCHDDSSASTGGTALTGKHNAHITAIGGGNAACASCHNDNTGEGKPANDFGAKAYPHASNGTEVSSTNATLANNLSDGTTIKNSDASLVTCTAACHPRSNLIAPAVKWDGSNAGCNMCHYYEAAPTAANNNAIAAGSLPGAHNLHFNDNITCDKCHPIPGDYSHATVMPVSSAGVTFAAGVGNSGSGLNITCQNSCHAATSPSWNTTVAVTGCSTCHFYPGASNDYAANSNNGHVIRYMTAGKKGAPLTGYTTITASGTYNTNLNVTHLNVATAYNKTGDSYATVTSDQTLCGKCHSGGTHMNGVKDVNAGTGNAAGFTLVTSYIGGQGHVAQCSNAKCHFNRKTPNWY